MSDVAEPRFDASEDAMTNSLPADPARRFWVTATSVVGGAGLVATAVPFVASLSPSEKARASGAPVEFGLQSLQPGDRATVAWRGKPVFVVRRSQAMLDSLARHDELLLDPNSRRENEPDYARNGARSSKPEFLV